MDTNSLSGPIPDSIGDLPNLYQLYGIVWEGECVWERKRERERGHFLSEKVHLFWGFEVYEFESVQRLAAFIDGKASQTLSIVHTLTLSLSLPPLSLSSLSNFGFFPLLPSLLFWLMIGISIWTPWAALFPLHSRGWRASTPCDDKCFFALNSFSFFWSLEYLIYFSYHTRAPTQTTVKQRPQWAHTPIGKYANYDSVCEIHLKENEKNASVLISKTHTNTRTHFKDPHKHTHTFQRPTQTHAHISKTHTNKLTHFFTQATTHTY